MSTIFSSSTNFMMLKVTGDLPGPEALFPFLSESLRKFAFRDISETLDEQFVGWVQVDDHTATGFDSPEYVWIDKFVFLALRKDVRRVPGAVLKQEIADREAAWLEEHPDLRRAPKKVREDIKESAKLALLDKTLPTPKLLHAVWDTEAGAMYLLTASNADLDLFLGLFCKTFEGLGIHAVTPFDIAGAAVSDSFPLLEKFAAANQSTTGSYLDLVKSNSWIGRSFALWLLDDGGVVPGVSAWVGDKLVLAGDGKKVVVSGPIDENITTIRSALDEGKFLADITVMIEDNDGNTWKLGLNTDTFWFKGVKCPSVLLERDENVPERQADMLLRIGMLRKMLLYLFDGFLREFLRQRFSVGAV